MDNAEYPNVRNKNDQKYNNKIESTKSLIQCDCIFILKYYKNIVQKQDCELLVKMMKNVNTSKTRTLAICSLSQLVSTDSFTTHRKLHLNL